MKVSIVLPVYNTKRELLERLLNSIFAQTEQSFEIIIVDDGSNQETATVLDELAAKDTRITVYHQVNQGKGGFPARYDGIAKAKGDYIYIPDSDDYLHPQLLEYCLWVAENKKADFIAFRFTKIHGSEVPEIRRLPPFEKCPLTIVNKDSDVETQKKAISLIHVDNWAQFAKRELMQSLPKREVSDLTRTFRLVKGSTIWAATELPLYFYDSGVEGSVTHKKYNIDQITYLHKDLIELCELYAIEIVYESAIWKVIFKSFVEGSLKIAYNAIKRRELVCERKLYIKEFADTLHDIFCKKGNHICWLRLKYQVKFLILILKRKLRVI